MKKEVIDENLSLIQGTLERWISFKKFLLISFTDQELTGDDESNFLEIKSSIARSIRTLSERFQVEGKLDYGEKVIRELLNKCVSVTHLRGLPLNDRRQIYKEWHKAFVRLSRAVGALKFMSEGYVPPTPGKKKGKGGKSSGSGSKKAVIAVVVVILLAVLGAGAWLMGFI